MYTPRAFAEKDLAELDRLFERDAFVTLLTSDADGSLLASHLPVLYRREGSHVLVEGHWARPNPQSRLDGDAMMIVHGPHAYISPAWYADKEPAARVPTWNYAVAHLHGRLERNDEAGALAALVSRLSDRFEASVGSDWRFDAMREDLAVQLSGIVGFRFEPHRIEMKFKLNQNHPAANVDGAATALERLGGEQRRDIAALMRARLAPRDPTRE